MPPDSERTEMIDNLVVRLRHEDSMNPERDAYRHEVLGKSAASLSALKAEVVKWKWLASRARCGCLAKDCCVHGSYYEEPDEIAPVVFRSYEQAKDLQRQYYDTALKEPDRE